MTHAFLWDLDGTLLTTARAGVLALEDATEELFGTRADFSGLITSGLTDAAVATACIQAAGGKLSDDVVDSFLRAYERQLPDRLSARQGHVMPNVREVLERLAARADAVSLLLTGNTRLGARAKLRHYGLDGLIADGAFCVDGAPRDEIARRAGAMVAVQLAVGPGAVFVIGDTPVDIAAGKAIGAKTIAVATGPHTLATLAEHEPWAALETLPGPDEFERLVGLL